MTYQVFDCSSHVIGNFDSFEEARVFMIQWCADNEDACYMIDDLGNEWTCDENMKFQDVDPTE